MTGLCLTCHGSFHAPSSTEGAFLRHPADYVIPNSGEFTYYTEYDVTAPVGRPHSVFVDTDMWPSDVVTPGEDLVMCLSCHVAHASENDGMLRYEYDAAGAGSLTDIAAAQALGGCFACHPTKGVLPEFR